MAFKGLAVFVDKPENAIRGTEEPFEKLKLLCQQFINAYVRGIPGVAEVDDDDIMLLPVAMATADALLDTLRIPGQVEITN